MLRRIFGFVLCICLSFAVYPVTALAVSDENDGDGFWIYENYALFPPEVNDEEITQKFGSSVYVIHSSSQSKSVCTYDTLHIGSEYTYTCICVGDADFDGEITAADARITLRAGVGLEELSRETEIAADVDFSGDITASDARNILRAGVGLEAPEEWLKKSDRLTFLLVIVENKPSQPQPVDNVGAYIASQLELFPQNDETKCTIDISEYNIQDSEIFDFVQYYVFDDPSFFYVMPTFGCSYNDDSISEISFELCENAKEKKADYNNRINEIVSLSDGTWSEFEYALFFHDYICENFRYDTDYEIYDAYSMLVWGRGVCQAYSMLYKELLISVGVECRYVSSDEMNHSWNIVTINGKNYHVDVTGDDPLPDMYGSVEHKNFLMSDTEAERQSHYAWSVCGEDVACDSEYYDGAAWKTSTSAFVFADGKWYFINDTDTGYGLFETDFGSFTALKKQFDFSWDYIRCFSGLGYADGCFIYNSPTEVTAFSLRDGSEQQLYKVSGSKRIYGSRVSENSVYFVLSNSYTYTQDDIVKIDIK